MADTPPPPAGEQAEGQWACSACTLINERHQLCCAVCGLERAAAAPGAGDGRVAVAESAARPNIATAAAAGAAAGAAGGVAAEAAWENPQAAEEGVGGRQPSGSFLPAGTRYRWGAWTFTEHAECLVFFTHGAAYPAPTFVAAEILVDCRWFHYTAQGRQMVVYPNLEANPQSTFHCELWKGVEDGVVAIAGIEGMRQALARMLELLEPRGTRTSLVRVCRSEFVLFTGALYIAFHESGTLRYTSELEPVHLTQGPAMHHPSGTRYVWGPWMFTNHEECALVPSPPPPHCASPPPPLYPFLAWHPSTLLFPLGRPGAVDAWHCAIPQQRLFCGGDTGGLQVAAHYARGQAAGSVPHAPRD